MRDNQNKSPLDQWVAISREISFQKKLSMVVGGFCAVLTMLILSLVFRDPIVAVVNEKQLVMLKGERKAIPIGEEQVERVIKEFIQQRYRWDKLKPEEILRRVEPFVTKGLNRKILPILSNLKNKKLQGKSVSQKITDVDVQVTDKGVMAKFYKVLVIENIPLVIPTGLMLAVVQGAQTTLNPAGIYINRVLESAAK